MSIYDKTTEEWFSKRPGQESTVEQCDQCGLYYKPSLGHKCKVKAGEKIMTVEEALTYLRELVPPSARHLEAMRLAKEALEKQIPKKPIGDLDSVPHYRCPYCNRAVKLYENDRGFDFCPDCGQHIDWNEDDNS